MTMNKHKPIRYYVRNVLLVVFFAFLIATCSTDDQDDNPITFFRTYGEQSIRESGYSIQQTSDGGYIFCGGIMQPDSVDDALITKTDAHGSVAWSSLFNTGKDCWFTSIQQTNDEGYIAYGRSFPGTFLVKTDSTGTEEWSRTYHVTGDYCYGNMVRETSDGGYILCGSGRGDDYYNASSDAFLLKVDCEGYEEWSTLIGDDDTNSINCVQQTVDGGYILCGSSTSNSSQNTNIYLVKTDRTGGIEWEKNYGGNLTEHAYFVQQTTDQGYVTCGNYLVEGDTQHYYSAFTMRTDAMGNELWLNVFENLGISSFICVTQTDDEGFFLAGSQSSNDYDTSSIVLMALNPQGIELWKKTYSKDTINAAYSAQQTTDGGFVVCGTSLDHDAYWSDIFVLKTDTEGAI